MTPAGPDAARLIAPPTSPPPGGGRRAQDVKAAEHIDSGIVVRLPKGPAHVRLRRGVEHDVGFERGDDVAKRRPVADVDALETRPGRNIARRAGREIVEDADGVAIRYEAVDEMGTDEACPTRHEGAQRRQGFVPFPSVSSASTFLSTLS